MVGVLTIHPHPNLLPRGRRSTIIPSPFGRGLGWGFPVDTFYSDFSTFFIRIIIETNFDLYFLSLFTCCANKKRKKVPKKEKNQAHD